jgi:hypothetical protein
VEQSASSALAQTIDGGAARDEDEPGDDFTALWAIGCSVTPGFDERVLHRLARVFRILQDAADQAVELRVEFEKQQLQCFAFARSHARDQGAVGSKGIGIERDHSAGCASRLCDRIQ